MLVPKQDRGVADERRPPLRQGRDYRRIDLWVGAQVHRGGHHPIAPLQARKDSQMDVKAPSTNRDYCHAAMFLLVNMARPKRFELLTF